MTSLGPTIGSVRSRGPSSVAASAAANVYEYPDESRQERHHAVPAGLNGAGHYAPRSSSLADSAKLSKARYSALPTAIFGLPGGPAGGLSRVEVRLLLAVVVLAFFVRTYKIGQPSSVV